MARPLYSALLFEGSAGGGSYITSESVPDGYIWVVRDIVFSSTGYTDLGISSGLFGMDIEDSSGIIIYGVFTPDAVSNRLYHWQGRQVLEVGDNLNANLGGVDFWYWRCTGYILTSP